jgi:hypothetical protein
VAFLTLPERTIFCEKADEIMSKKKESIPVVSARFLIQTLLIRNIKAIIAIVHNLQKFMTIKVGIFEA